MSHPGVDPDDVDPDDDDATDLAQGDDDAAEEG